MASLTQKLKDRISNQGPITFRDFMQAALYDPESGYYNTERLKIGPAGDYYTSSNVHAAFGASLARLFADLLGTNRDANSSTTTTDHFEILEAGAGTGQLALDILTALRAEHPDVYSRINYLIAERSPEMERRQRSKLKPHSGKVEWVGVTANGHPSVETVTGILFSNELIDALPVHVARAVPGGLEELLVTAPAERREDNSSDFCFSWGAPSTEEIRRYLEIAGARLSEGQIVEVNLDAAEWLRAVARILETGYLVTIDYGDVAGHLYSQDRMHGTLRSFYKHALAPSVLDRPGVQDITASVNFTALMEYGRHARLETVSFERQSAFLIRMGLIDRIAAMEMKADPMTDLRDRLAVKNLFAPGGSSDNFRVLIQRKLRT
jgi:SAM-dependent MidA family methyltransferase